MKFRQLYNVAGEVTSPNPGPGVLSVDLNGNVILVPDATGGDVSACGPNQTAHRLTKWVTGNNLVCETIVHEDVGATTKIGIDIFSNLRPAKLDVNNQDEEIGAFITTTRTISTFPGINTGVYGNSTGSSYINIGTRGVSTNVSSTYPVTAKTGNIGVYGQALSPTWNDYSYGGRFETKGPLRLTKGYGVWASAPYYAGYFVGNIRVNNTTIASDIMFKDSIQDITGESALAKLSKIQPKEFVFKTDDFPLMNFDITHQFGIIAQNLDTILPELVYDVHHPQELDSTGALAMDSLNYKAVNYNGLIGILVAGVNELNNAKVSSCANPTDSNYVTKWDAVNNVLCNSLIYDNGTNVGIGTIENLGGARLTVRGGTGLAGIQAQGDTIGAIFTGGMAGIYSFTDSVTTSHAGVVAVSENATVANIGILGSAGGVELPGPEDDPMNVGVAGLAQIPTENKNIGVIAMSQRSSAFNAAVMALSEDEEADTAVNAGVIAFASGSDSVNVGGFFGAEDTTGINIGIYATATGSDSSSAGHFAGDITETGSVYETSDQKLKRNITDMDAQDALEVIKALKPKSYEYRTEDYGMLSLQEGVRHGLIAQEVEQILPELVTTRVQPEIKGLKGKTLSERADFKAVNYSGLIPYLISAMQAQQATIEEQQSRIDSLSSALKSRLTNLENTINQCCGVGYRQSNPEEQAGDEEGNANHLTVELSLLQVVILEQNVPNPFKEQTSISYFIPEETGKAQMLFFDITGRIIKTVELQKGYGIMTVFAQNLSSGTYSYSLVIDGEVVETKRMVKK